MKVYDLVNQVKNISGYNSNHLSTVDSEVELVNDNMIFKGLNEARLFVDAEIMPDEFSVPLNIDVNTDMIGGDLINVKLSSYNEGSLPTAASKVPWKEMLNIPWKLLSSGIGSIKPNAYNNNYVWYSSFGNRIVFDSKEYMNMCSMGSVGELTVNKIKSNSLVCKHLSTLKTVFELQDNNGNKISEYSVTTNTNVFKFSFNFVDIAINYSTGLITAFYRGNDTGEYKIIIKTLSHPSGVVYFNDGNLRIAKVNNIHNQETIAIRIRTYSLYDFTQKIPYIYTSDLLSLLSYKGALEVQRFNRSMDNNLSIIVSNKIADYSNRERFSTLGQTNNLNYF